MTIRIGFTGHRDKLADPEDLRKIHEAYPDAIWIHGNNRKGFDAQVNFFGELYGHVMIKINPEYDKYYWRVAPLKRNETIVNTSDVIVALYDNRPYGGTFYTICYALEMGKEIKYLPCP